MRPWRSSIVVLAALLLGGCSSLDGVAVQLGGAATTAQLTGPWQPRPYALAPGVLAQADTLCRRDMGVVPGTPLVVADARGEGRIELYYASANGDSAECNSILIAKDGSMQPGGAGGSGTGQTWPPIAPNAVEITSSGSSGDQNGTTDTHRAGRAGIAVTRVAVRLSDRPDLVDATLTNGWWAVWWPGNATCTALIGFSADGSSSTNTGC